MSKAKILFIDIENAPIRADVWGLWGVNVGVNQIRENGFLLSYAAKFLGSDKVYYEDIHQRGKDEKTLLKGLSKLIEEADIVVAQNGDKHDLPWIRTRMVKNRMRPFPPIKTIDTLKIAKKVFKFHSNKLEFLADFLGIGKKLKHGKFPGHDLWVECMKGNPEAWEEMREYNINDVIILEDVFLALRPWMTGNPNLGVMLADGTEQHTCPKCGGVHLEKRGFAYTGVSKFQRYACQDCGGWSRGRTNLLTKQERKAVLANVV